MPSPSASRPAVAEPTLPSFPPYEPLAVEDFINGKRTAARFVQAFGTFSGDADRKRALDAAAADGVHPTTLRRQLAAMTAPLSAPRGASTEIVYPQCGGLRPLAFSATYMSVMTVFRQHTLNRSGAPRAVTRVADVRLRVVGGVWRVDELASIGGQPVPAPPTLPPSGRVLLAASGVDLPGPARWDIYAGRVHPRLLNVLAALSRSFDFRVSVLNSSHPRHVVATATTGGAYSSHALGLAGDLWSIDGVPVCEQRSKPNPPALALVKKALTLDPDINLGMPPPIWKKVPHGQHTFTNLVHEDHVHVAIGKGLPASEVPSGEPNPPTG